MNKIIFEFIDIEGVRSIIKPFHFYLNKPGLNLLKGPNGSGKTTVFESLYWCTYGENLKDTNQDAIVTWSDNRTSQWQGTRVMETFSILQDTYCIARHLNYKGLTFGVKGEDHLMLSKNGVMLGDYRNKKETQQEINRILGVDARTFINSILFGQRMSKLIQQDNKDKRELFETLFETEWVGAAKIKCDKDITTWESDLLKLGRDIEKSSIEIIHLTDRLSTAKATIASYEEMKNNRILVKQNELTLHNSGLSAFNNELKEYTESLSKIQYDAEAHGKLNDQFDTLEKQFNEANLAQRDYNNGLVNAKRLVEIKTADRDRDAVNLKKLTDKHIEDKCPYCEQELKTGNKLEINHNNDIDEATKKAIKSDIALKEAEKALKAFQKIKAPATPESITKAKEEVSEQLTAIESVKESFDQLNGYIKDATADKTQTERGITRITQEIEDIKAEKPPVIDIKNIELPILQEQDKLKTAQRNKLEVERKLEIARWWSTKALSSSGLKAYVFTAMLTQLNQHVKTYGDRLGASLEFSIDLTKASKPFTTKCSLGDKLDKDYKDFSGGEKDRLDICLMFAMYSLISMGTDMNLLIMDEPFSGLDEEGEAIVFELVREQAETGKSVYVITHSATLDSLYANKIEFSKLNGNTLILN